LHRMVIPVRELWRSAGFSSRICTDSFAKIDNWRVYGKIA
jgi:hypothetical protein